MQDYIFHDEKRSIQINRIDLPSPWINYLSNGHMHAFVSQAAGGAAWMENAGKMRFTRYRQFNIPIDSPGFYIYIREKDGTVWSPAFRPAETELDSYHAEHMPGKTRFYAQKNGTEAILTLFIAPDYDIMVWNLELKSNKQDETFDVFAYVELSQHNVNSEFSSGYYWRHMLKTWYDEKSQSVQYLYHSRVADLEKVPLLYFASDRDVLDYSGDRDAFLGNYRTEAKPISVERGYCNNEIIQSGEPCAALHIRMECKRGITEHASFFLGAKSGGLIHAEEVEEAILSDLANVRNADVRASQEQKLDCKWETFLGKFDCDIPDKNAQRQINTWGPLASMHTARYSRSVNATAPGLRGLGYRDTCQDMLAMTYRDMEMVEKCFEYLMTRQFETGNSVHGEGDPKVRCDDHLWPTLLAYSMLAETGDFTLLQKKYPYNSLDGRTPGKEATVWEHLLAEVEFTHNNLGVHGLPLTFHGDWNDIIHKFSEEGKGESVFAAQQYVATLEKLIEIAMYIDDEVALERLQRYLNEEQESIEKHCWNGKWWYRCFDDDGNPIGGETDEFGKIWINSQTWSVIGNSGTKEMQRKAMDAVHEMLDTGVGLMKLTPGFETWPKVKDPFSGYNPGTGENGAIFCHAHTWAVVAEAMLGNADLAWKYYNDLVPHNALQKVGIECYKAEPYTWCSNIVGAGNNKQGWGNVSHITGAVAWMNVAATQYLLGVRPVLKGIVLDPCIPAEWDGFDVKRLFRGCWLHIHVDNSQHVQKGVKYLEIDGTRMFGNCIDEIILSGKKELHIRVIMGK